MRAGEVLAKAMDGALRSIYYEPLGPFPCEAHKSLVDALAAYGPSKMVLVPDSERFSSTIRQEANWQPDLAIFGYFGDRIPLSDLAYLRERGAYLVKYIADASIFNAGLYAISQACDMTVVSSPAYFPDLASRGIDAGYFPGWTQHHYLEVERSVTGPDVVFIGSLYPDTSFTGVRFRRECVQAMAQSGIGFDVYGPGWERVGVPSRGSTFGQYTRNAQIYAGAKVGLSVDDVRDRFCICSDRPYNIAATGCMVLTASFPGMEWNGWVDGETCVSFETIPEMLDKARWYISHDEERERIGQAGREMTQKRHTWVQRVEALWSMMEGLEG